MASPSLTSTAFIIPPNLKDRYRSFSVVKIPESKKGSLMVSLLNNSNVTGIFPSLIFCVIIGLSFLQPVVSIYIPRSKMGKKRRCIILF
jgi:hypothetical protein